MPGSYAEWLAFSEVARNLGLLAAAVLGVGVGAWRTYAANRQARAAEVQARLARRDHITELFVRAVDQLGNDKLEVRFGAIYTLKQIMREDEYREWTTPILETLTAYVREKTSAADDSDPPPDVAAVIEMLRIQIQLNVQSETGNGEPRETQ